MGPIITGGDGGRLQVLHLKMVDPLVKEIVDQV